MAKANAKLDKGLIFLIILSVIIAALTAFVIVDGMLHRSSFLKDKVFINALTEALGADGSRRIFPANITKEELAKVKVLHLDGNYYPDWGYIGEGFNLMLGYDEAAQYLRNSEANEDYEDENAESYFISGFSEVDITDFSNLEYFPNLEYIRIYYQPNLRNLSFFENMASLESARIEIAVNATDFSPLSGLTSLRNLTVMGSNIKNTDVFADLTGLENLSLVACNLSDISGISNLTELKSLAVSSNSLDDNNITLIGDLTPLQNLSKLEQLYLRSSHISDISALSGLTSLETLVINDNNIENISALSRLANLTELNISENRISDLSVLANLPKLELLIADDMGVSDLTPLADLKLITRLSLKGNAISDLTPLANLTALETLVLDENIIEDISPLETLKNSLKNLSASSNEIADIGILESFELLENLNLDYNYIEDFLPLVALEELGVIQVSGYDTQLVGWDDENWDDWDDEDWDELDE